MSAEATALPRYAHTERSWAASCPKGCGKKFAHGPALAAHVKACYFYNELNVPTRGEELSEEEDEPAVQTTEDATILEDSASDCAPEEQQPVGVGFKRRKDGTGFKRTGLQEGQRRGRSHTIHFKYEVVQHYRSLQAMKQRGLLGTYSVWKIYPQLLILLRRSKCLRGRYRHGQRWRVSSGKHCSIAVMYKEKASARMVEIR